MWTAIIGAISGIAKAINAFMAYLNAQMLKKAGADENALDAIIAGQEADRKAEADADAAVAGDPELRRNADPNNRTPD